MTLPAAKTRELLIIFSRTVYPSTSTFLAPDLLPSLHTMARMAITTAEVQQRITFPLIDSPSNLIYHPLYVPDPHDRARRQAFPTRPCTRKMTPIQSMAGESKRNRQRPIRLGPRFRPRSPYSPLRYPTCPSPPSPLKICTHLTQTPVDLTALAIPSTETIAQVPTCYRLYLTKLTHLASW